MFADLHLHTHFSDGTYTPEELVREAVAKGLSAIALTDHDTVDGCPRTAEACERSGVEFIAGTELTADYNGTEVHILGYFVDVENPLLIREISKCQATRQDRIREMVLRLNRQRVPLKAERVFAIANCRSPGRPHVARALVEDGFCSSMDEAFERFLKRSRPAWVPKRRICSAEAIAILHQAGGLAVMAHPGLNRTDDVIRPAVEAGLDGIECFHTKHSTATAERYLELADRYKLLVTGGSDCHGMSKGRPLIGTIKLPYQHVELLKIAVARRRASTGPAGRSEPVSPTLS